MLFSMSSTITDTLQIVMGKEAHEILKQKWTQHTYGDPGQVWDSHYNKSPCFNKYFILQLIKVQTI